MRACVAILLILVQFIGFVSSAQSNSDAESTQLLVDLSNFAIEIYEKQENLGIENKFANSPEGKIDTAIEENNAEKIRALIKEWGSELDHVDVYERTAQIFENGEQQNPDDMKWLVDCFSNDTKIRAHKCAISLSSIHLYNLDINNLIDWSLKAVEIAKRIETDHPKYWYVNGQSNEYLLVGFIYDRNIQGTAQVGRYLAQSHLDEGIKYEGFILINNIAHVASKELGPEAALLVLEPAKRIVDRLDNKEKEVTYYALGKNYMLAEKYSEALDNYLKYENVKSRADLETSANANLAMIYSKLGNLDKAKEYYRLAWPSVEENIESNRGVTVLKAKKNIAILESRFEDALEIDKVLDSVNESLDEKAFSANRERLSKNLEIANARRQRETDKLQFEAELAAQKTKARNIQLLLAFFALAFLVGLLTHIFRSYREEQRLNAEIRLKNDELEDANANLNEANKGLKRTFARLEVALRQAMAGQDAKQKFIGVVGHELRTPLNPIINLSEVLEAKAQNSKDKALLKAIKNAGKRLHVIVENMLAIASVDKDSSVYIEMVDVVEETKIIVEEFVPDMNDRNEKLKPDGLFLSVNMFKHPELKPLQVGNKIVFRSIVRNLFDNAMKFTPHGEIAVRLKPRKERPGFQLEISDTGPGIDEEKIDSFMRPFEQAEMGLGRSHEGAGLGLAVVQKYCEQLGAKMNIKSTIGQGTCIIIDFPEPVHESQTGRLLKVA